MYRFPAVALLWVLGCTLPAIPGVADDSFRPDQSQLPAPAPKDAVVLFQAEGANRFVAMDGGKISWPIEDGALVSTHAGRNTNHIVSELHFRDADIHVEFMLPEKGSGNSGVYIHGNYELQIINSSNKGKVDMDSAGSLYRYAKPLKQACRKPGEWQVFDIRYRAPRRNENGEITEKGAITAWLNGVKIHEDVRFGEPNSPYHPYRHGTTPYLEKIWKQQKETSVGPVFLQDHNNPVRFRNVWVEPLDDKAFSYKPGATTN